MYLYLTFLFLSFLIVPNLNLFKKSVLRSDKRLFVIRRHLHKYILQGLILNYLFHIS